jgi:hypothetical protein
MAFGKLRIASASASAFNNGIAIGLACIDSLRFLAVATLTSSVLYSFFAYNKSLAEAKTE